jgi:UDP-4-amino-4-deoxy-L-arabinose-oxoglutarate aminotransferase
MDSLFLTTGPKTNKFEKEFADFLKVKYSLGVTSCTSALFLVLKAWGLSKGDKVLVPAMTFIATANAVLQTGADVVFCDVDPATGLIDLNLINELISNQPSIKVIIPVHLYGQMVDVTLLKKIINNRDIKILEDAAHCVEGEINGIKPGQIGDAAAFSFYATKNITSGEGGAVATNDEILFEKIKILRLHGMSKSAIDRHTYYQHWDMEQMGFKANMNDIQASMLIPQLKKIETNRLRREKVASIYESEFIINKIRFPKTNIGIKNAYHLFTIWVGSNLRDTVLDELQKRGIGVAVNYRAVHLRKFYKENFNYKEGDYPNAEKIGNETISIPMYPKLTVNEIEYIVTNLIEIKKLLKFQ